LYVASHSNQSSSHRGPTPPPSNTLSHTYGTLLYTHAKSHASHPTTTPQIGLPHEDFLNFTGDPRGDVTDPRVHEAVIAFVRARVAASDAVVVAGGPPCQRYSTAASARSRFPRRYDAMEADQELLAAFDALGAAKTELAACGPSLGDLAAAGARVSTAAAAIEAAKRVSLDAHARAKVEAEQDAGGLCDADEVVRSYLWLYKAVEAEARAAGKPCYIVMENPYSNRYRGLWNRWGPRGWQPCGD
jgi:hypothetical protein